MPHNRDNLNSSKHVQVELPSNWYAATAENPSGGATYRRFAPPGVGWVQISWAWYRGGPEPRPSDDDLMQLASGADFGTAVRSTSGPCAIGRYGTAVYRSAESAYTQVWHLSNGRDFIFVTYVCSNPPDAAELCDVQAIVENLTIGKS